MPSTIFFCWSASVGPPGPHAARANTVRGAIRFMARSLLLSSQGFDELQQRQLLGARQGAVARDRVVRLGTLARVRLDGLGHGVGAAVVQVVLREAQADQRSGAPVARARLPIFAVEPIGQ